MEGSRRPKNSGSQLFAHQRPKVISTRPPFQPRSAEGIAGLRGRRRLTNASECSQAGEALLTFPLLFRARRHVRLLGRLRMRRTV